jgi:hypothetical protein
MAFDRLDRKFYSMCKKIFLLFYYISMCAASGQQLHLSRFDLYKQIIDHEQNAINPELIHHLKEHQEYYFDLLESLIVKRDHRGNKDTSFNFTKIAYGAGKVIIPLLAYCGLTQSALISDTGVKNILTVMAGLCVLSGIRTIYKGIFYKKRMEQKLARDKAVRRFLREATGQI